MTRQGIRRWRGGLSLLHDAVDATTGLVDLGHESTMRSVRGVADRLGPLRAPVRFVDAVRRPVTRGVLVAIRALNRMIGAAGEVALASLEQAVGETPEAESRAAPLRSDAAGTAAWLGEAALGIVNAAVGDRLSASGNGCDLSMAFRLGDRYLELDPEALRSAVPEPGSRVALFVHGLATTEWSWCLGAEAHHGDPTATFGSLLERDLGLIPVYLRYNTGRPVAASGRRLARDLQRFVDAYPVPIDDLTLVGHSMGGLVVRSACHHGALESRPWTSLVRRVVCLGSPHRGAPLAALAHGVAAGLGAIDLPACQILARILATRSAGVRDLRHGSVVGEEGPPTPLHWLPGVRHHFLSGSLAENPAHPLGCLAGDLLVRLPSSSGPAVDDPEVAVETHRFGGVAHHRLLNHPAVYDHLRRACGGA